MTDDLTPPHWGAPERPERPEMPIGEDVVWWYVFLWEPIWILGGALYFMTAMLFGRALRADRAAGPR